MVEWIWLAGAGFFAIGLTGGYFWGQSSASGRRVKELESEVSDARQELDQYRERVVEHFQNTGDLVNNLTESYRAVYQHLAVGAQELCGDQTMGLTAEREGRLPPVNQTDELKEVTETERHETKQPNGDAGSDVSATLQHSENTSPGEAEHELDLKQEGISEIAGAKQEPSAVVDDQSSAAPFTEDDTEKKRATVH